MVIIYFCYMITGIANRRRWKTPTVYNNNSDIYQQQQQDKKTPTSCNNNSVHNSNNNQLREETHQPFATVMINVWTSSWPKIGFGLSIGENFHLAITKPGNNETKID